MLVLALDTSSAATTVAIVRLDAAITPLASRTNVDARAHGEVLAPLIEAALADLGAGIGELTAIVVGVGPGPFTGLRVGLVTAAALSDALKIPAYGACSLDGIGAALPEQSRLLVAGDARRREVYWAAFRSGRRETEPNVAKPDSIATGGFTAAAGAGARMYAEVLGLPLLDQDYPDPLALVEVAADRIRRHDPSEALTPLYLRRPDAVEPGQRKRVLA